MSSLELDLAEVFEVRTMDEITIGFRDIHGSYRVGHLEEDPEMVEYEELLELGRSLRG